jgi:hypothetical protein
MSLISQIKFTAHVSSVSSHNSGALSSIFKQIDVLTGRQRNTCGTVCSSAEAARCADTNLLAFQSSSARKLVHLTIVSSVKLFYVKDEQNYQREQVIAMPKGYGSSNANLHSLPTPKVHINPLPVTPTAA